ncbi:unnamed protein product, partial [Timema podura]|nr:unnamed protein product [Timema podura]
VGDVISKTNDRAGNPSIIDICNSGLATGRRRRYTASTADNITHKNIPTYCNNWCRNQRNEPNVNYQNNPVYCIWEDSIRMDLKEIGCSEVDWIELAQDRDRSDLETSSQNEMGGGVGRLHWYQELMACDVPPCGRTATKAAACIGIRMN